MRDDMAFDDELRTALAGPAPAASPRFRGAVMRRVTRTRVTGARAALLAGYALASVSVCVRLLADFPPALVAGALAVGAGLATATSTYAARVVGVRP